MLLQQMKILLIILSIFLRSALYGPYGVSGVINIITKKPTEQFEGKADLRYGSFDTYEPTLYIGGLMERGVYYGLNYK